MLENTEIAKLSRRFVCQSALAVVLLSLAVVSLSLFAHVGGLARPLVVSAVFALVVELADIAIWSRVAEGEGKMLPTFFSAVSGFRMLLGLAVLGGCYIAVGRDAMAEYCLVFMVFYLWVIIHHSVFFSRVSSTHTKCDNEKK